MEQFLTGLGLSGSAGLNAYLPLLILGVMQRAGAVEVGQSYEGLGSLPVIIVLVVLLLIEMGADKIPAVDHMNDVVQTAIRPAAGALLFIASTSGIEADNTTLITLGSLLGGSLSAGSVHAVKATTRPAVTLTTAGLGNMIISLIEDVISFIVSLIAILLPFIVLFFTFSFFALALWMLWDMQRTRRYFPRDNEWEKPKRSALG